MASLFAVYTLALCSGGCQQVLLHACRTLRLLCSTCYDGEGVENEEENDWEDIKVSNDHDVVRRVTLAVFDAGIWHSLVKLLDHTCAAVQMQALWVLYEMVEADSYRKVRRQAIPNTAAVGEGVAFGGVKGCFPEASLPLCNGAACSRKVCLCQRGRRRRVVRVTVPSAASRAF